MWMHARLLADIFSMKVFVALLGRNGELLDSHLFFFDRYSALADFHRMRGRTAKAERLTAIAEFPIAPRLTTNRQAPPRWRCRCRGRR